MARRKILLPLIAPIDSPWNQMINALTSPKLFLQGRNDLIEKPKLIFRAYVFAELIRQKWGRKTFKELRTRAEIFKLEAALWHRVLDLIQEIFLLDPSGYDHPAIWFTEVILEEKACCLISCCMGKDASTRQLQAENHQLNTRTNPFDQLEEPHTWKFIQQSIKWADKSRSISTQNYTPMVKARQTLTTHLYKEGIILELTSNGFKQKRQGRSKKDLS